MFLEKLVLIAGVCAAGAAAESLTPVWIELGPAKQVLARVVVRSGSDCPVLDADGKPLAMRLRLPVPPNFEPACEALVSEGTQQRCRRAGIALQGGEAAVACAHPNTRYH